jgi:hypothetical protein
MALRLLRTSQPGDFPFTPDGEVRALLAAMLRCEKETQGRWVAVAKLEGRAAREVLDWAVEAGVLG